ncbi:Gfo/Idh/MocA family protein [Actinomadura roseirufa]|uniref:Gfo/Idh/MocA family protein n=1 Tax=Actinomadura roseirufa TaxID=2094049 RepID=UPI0010414CA6|nr:Gfo/Idh/MocA family oxidoreductase [Actinomadura roseirufa]
MLSSALTYQHEFDRRARVALAGCGGQAFRNILPSFRYAPLDLVATCDPVPGRAADYAKLYGAADSFDDLGKMLASVEIDAVFLATGYDENSAPRHPDQAIQVMESGRDVWMEKPAAATARDVERMHETSERTGRLAGVGLMKMFSPAVTRVHEIIQRPEFGRPSSFFIRDPEALPAPGSRDDATMMWLLDHLPHPASVVHRLMGPISRISVERAHNGAAFLVMSFTSGASGVWHMAWGQSELSNMERIEVVGEGANVVVDNNSRVTYYRPGHHGDGSGGYGRIGDYTSPLDEAPLHWEVNQYSGQPYNANVFVQGYAQEINYFAQRLLDRAPVRIGGLADAWHVARLFEAVRAIGDEAVDLPEAPAWAAATTAGAAS